MVNTSSTMAPLPSPRPPRKKACNPCSLAKVRCDHKRACCTRCMKRGIQEECVYEDPASQNPGDESDNEVPTGTLPSRMTAIDGSGQTNNPSAQTLPLPSFQTTPPTKQNASRVTTEEPQNLVFAHPDLVCTGDFEEIRNRWLKQYLPTGDQTQKTYSPHIISFVSRILKAYLLSLVQSGTLPPFVHNCQQNVPSISAPLANCLSLTRLCNRPLVSSQPVIQDTLQREMDRLFADYRDFNEIDLLAALQAYLIYAMLNFFVLDGSADNGIQQAMVNLQDIASETSRRGLVSAAELNQTRPQWESWIIAEGKRRTIFTMYLFDSVLCAHADLPSFLGTELTGIPTPSSKALWQASDRETWILAYNAHLPQWGMEGHLRIDELWPIPSNFSHADIETRRARVDQWLSCVDEFGTMLFAVTSCTHGG